MFGEAFLKMYENDEKYFETGFLGLDECIKGVTKGTVITIGSRPAMGKTSFSISICNHLLETGKKVLFCAIDSSESTAEKQFLQIKTEIYHNNYNNVDWEKLTQSIQYYNEMPFTLFCKVNMTLEELENKIKEEKPDIAFIDCIQFLKMPKAPNFTEAINLAIKEVKRIAVENNLIAVLTSQVSRAAESRYDKMPILSDLRNGSLLEDISDVIFLIYRDSYYNKDKKVLQDKADIIIAKNKFGNIDFIPLIFRNGIFSDYSTADYIKEVFS